MLTLKKRSVEKCNKIKGAGFNLVEVWECELTNDKELEKFLKT